jgi:thiol:disulfide interchange protein
MKKPLIYLFILLSVNLTFAQIIEPIKWTSELKNTGTGNAEIIMKATLEQGWHLYGLNIPDGGPKPTIFTFPVLKNAILDGKIVPKSKLHEEYDANFDMKLNWYLNEAVFVQKVTLKSASDYYIKAKVEYMLCNDETCLAPTFEEFELKGKTAKTTDTPAAVVETKVPDSIITTVQNPPASVDKNNWWKPVVEELRSFGNTNDAASYTSLWMIFLAGLLGGFIALFTPCVWPIIPMTVSFFLKRSDSKRKGRRDAMLYGLSIIVIYVTLGILITLLFGASALNDMSTNAVFNLLFFALLIIFAVSFFGAFEITLPSSWSTKLDSKAENTSGIISILLMAFVLALVSFSCTGPIIGFMLVEISTTGSILAPFIAMLGFAIALAIPFTLFAIFPSWLKSLPKSGGWLNKVKVILAFVELALALKFLSVADLAYGWHILDREVFLSLWIVIFALLGFYLLGKIRFPHDSESKHSSVAGTFGAIVSLAFAIYMIPGLWGAPLKAISAFSPPLYTQDFNLYDDEVHPAFTDYELGMQFAAEKGLPVVIDFTGFGCVNCRKMEASVWTNPEVKSLLEKKYVLISLFVDDKTPLKSPYEIVENGKTRKIETIGDKWSYLQRVKFGANAQPFYVMLDNNGTPTNKPYTFDEKPENFIKWLNKK